MRLTLRTLLAYMDGLLDPKDSQEIGKKIEGSQFATDLFHKIRDVMRRLRLAAPSLTERGTNLDCNTVAEYLDNALPADRVPDFEEVSLKSEMHLAEVASCHQILTMVLGEPAEIDPESRVRMYQLPTVAHRVDEERLAAAEAANALSGDGKPAPPPAPPIKSRPRPVVPEYLRDPPKKSRLLLAAAIMLFVGAAVGLFWVTVYPDSWHRMLAKLHVQQDNEDQDEHRGKKSPSSSSSEPARPSGDSRTESNGTTGSNGAAAPKWSNSALAEPANQSPPLAGGNNAGKTEIPVPVVEHPLPKPVPGIAPEATATSGTASAALSLAGTTAAPSPLVPSVAANGNKAKPAIPPAERATDLPPAKPPVDPVKADASLASNVGTPSPLVRPVNPPAAPGKAKVGRFMSDGEDVLLREEANNAGWRRVNPEDFLSAHQPLLALPCFRSRVVILNVNAMLELVNGTRIELLPDNAQSPPGVEIDFGRVVIKPLAQAGTSLRVVEGPHAGTLTLTNVAIAGLEATRVHESGTDPEKVHSHALTRLYLARGGAVWEEGDKQPVRLTAPATLTLDGTAADTPLGAVKELPKWITANVVNELDQRAATDVSKGLSPERAASLSLTELTEDRRKEVRGLAPC